MRSDKDRPQFPIGDPSQDRASLDHWLELLDRTRAQTPDGMGHLSDLHKALEHAREALQPQR